MKWSYVEAGTAAGPVDAATLRELVASGKIQPTTLVWQEGMGEWQPFNLVPELQAATARCSECSRLFPAEELVRIGAGQVCADCKPRALQKLKEGISMSEVQYGGFWIRFAAKCLDGILLFVLNMISSALLGVLLGSSSQEAPGILLAVTLLAQLSIQAAYQIGFLGAFGATPGKMLCKLQVVRPDGSPLTYGRATGRFFAEMLTGFTLTIGYIIAAFDDQRRTLHDRVADTRVIVKR